MEVEVKSMPRICTLNEIPELRVPPGELGAVLELVIRNKQGKVTDYRIMPSKSFVKQFLQLLWFRFAFVYGGNWGPRKAIRDTSNTRQWAYVGTNDFQCNAAVGVTSSGILVGTGTNPPSIDDYVMQTPIAHGTGSGQMQYSAVTFGAPASDGTTSQFTITRDFANNSGSSITVREIGLVVSQPGSFLTIRDAVNITVPNGETLTVNYRIQATV